MKFWKIFHGENFVRICTKNVETPCIVKKSKKYAVRWPSGAVGEYFRNILIMEENVTHQKSIISCDKTSSTEENQNSDQNIRANEDSQKIFFASNYRKPVSSAL